ncbi:MAG: 2-oxoacid:ferredoxin oxidoreductase subunit beta [Candidatus Fischerbacteria bacterium RBG_13_37_8]|uniref:2-oxoacid:ferredoxin oxidoreductase subunit beta n=1 Tax=Candidatus Fischerbacteria bacterium RBG_13_37_8 TaxID=1817863 RepID=A0A1F5VDI4_9BACT|nr:MAG: 2-oxoacid:ferredoxin oxidoreductase subunit beta [Candidatus Fischerbacteria bacterium RBG_13_37_8]
MSVAHDIYHPYEDYLRMDRIPHIWCPGCGIGTSVNCFIRAIQNAKIDHNTLSIVSGIGCTGRVAGYLKFDSFHTTHGRAIPFASGLKLANPKLNVVVYSGDGDLIAIGGNHFIHAARRNMDITVICVNNFIYGMTGGQVAPTTPLKSLASTMPYGNYEQPFNLPHLAASCGAVYVARWTVYHVRQLEKAMTEALQKKGFSLVEVIAPCPTLFERKNKLGGSLERFQFYKKNSVVKNGADTKELDLTMKGQIIVGKFVDLERPTWMEGMNSHFTSIFKDKYKPYEGTSDE